jgi:hypothetical protein
VREGKGRVFGREAGNELVYRDVTFRLRSLHVACDSYVQLERVLRNAHMLGLCGETVQAVMSDDRADRPNPLQLARSGDNCGEASKLSFVGGGIEVPPCLSLLSQALPREAPNADDQELSLACTRLAIRTPNHSPRQQQSQAGQSPDLPGPDLLPPSRAAVRSCSPARGDHAALP